MKARWTLSLPQTSRANPVQCCSTHQKKETYCLCWKQKSSHTSHPKSAHASHPLYHTPRPACVRHVKRDLHMWKETYCLVEQKRLVAFFLKKEKKSFKSAWISSTTVPHLPHETCEKRSKCVKRDLQSLFFSKRDLLSFFSNRKRFSKCTLI